MRVERDAAPDGVVRKEPGGRGMLAEIRRTRSSKPHDGLGGQDCRQRGQHVKEMKKTSVAGAWWVAGRGCYEVWLRALQDQSTCGSYEARGKGFGVYSIWVGSQWRMLGREDVCNEKHHSECCG